MEGILCLRRLKRQREILSWKGCENGKENRKMKRILIIVLSFLVLSANTLPAVQQKNQPLQATTAALVMQSLQLGDKAQQLFGIKGDILKIVKERERNYTLQEDMMIDASSEMRYIATVAYFEGNLLGAVLALKKEFKLHFINDRILELDNAIKGTTSSLQPIKVAHSRIEDRSIKGQLDRSLRAAGEILEIYRNSIEILRRIKEREFGEEEIRQPVN
jgi:hypothetical protein